MKRAVFALVLMGLVSGCQHFVRENSTGGSSADSGPEDPNGRWWQKVDWIGSGQSAR